MLAVVEEPVNRLELPASRSRWLAATLRERVLAGVYQPGEWIREATLREEFGVSNGPVREALQELTAEKLLERVPYRGVRVVSLESQDIIEVFQLRSAMIELAAELAARKRDPVAIAKIPDLLDFLTLNLHGKRPFTGILTTWVAEASGNARLIQASREIFSQTLLYVPKTRASKAHFELALEHSRAMIAAIAAGKPARARNHARAFTRVQLAALGLDAAL